jgi:hypothetical protein
LPLSFESFAFLFCSSSGEEVRKVFCREGGKAFFTKSRCCINSIKSGLKMLLLRWTGSHFNELTTDKLINQSTIQQPSTFLLNRPQGLQPLTGSTNLELSTLNLLTSPISSQSSSTHRLCVASFLLLRL